MKIHLILAFLPALLASYCAQAQDTLYFDKHFETVSKSAAQYVEILTCDPVDTNKCSKQMFRVKGMKLLRDYRYSRYSERKLDGKCLNFYKNGGLWVETTYQNGLKQGKQNVFYENGKLKRSLDWIADSMASVAVFSKDGSPKTEVTPKDYDESDTQIPPSFPGGKRALFHFLVSKTKYPNEAKKNNIHGTVKVSFVVGINGNVQNIQLVKGVHPILDQEALKVIKLMPKWSPATVCGIPVKVRFEVPIHFNLK
jgi:TonB family protein